MKDAVETSDAGIVVATEDFDASFAFYTGLGFRVEQIFPADSPRRATLVGYGLRLHLEPGEPRSVVLRFRVSDDAGSTLVAPEGTLVEFVSSHAEIQRPRLQSSLSITQPSEGWHAGRAGMLYRDLVPDRQGDCVIASHIRIPTGGPVPDYVHFHEVGFQLIFCHRGWVEVVYEGQGEPFVLEAGDCVIQPPTIRHRVLRSSDEMHVVEVGYPAEHVTKADPATTLPSPPLPPEHEWSGQRFVRFHSTSADWIPDGSVSVADTGVRVATGGRADVKVVRGAQKSSWSAAPTPERTFRMVFVLEGKALVTVGDQTFTAEDSTTTTVPVGQIVQAELADDTRLLLVDIVTD